LDPLEVLWSILQPQQQQQEDSHEDDQAQSLSQQHTTHQFTYSTTHSHYTSLQQQHTTLQRQVTALEQQLKEYTSELQLLQQQSQKLQEERSRNKTQLLKSTRRYAELQHQWKQASAGGGGGGREWQQLVQAVASRQAIDEWHHQAETQLHIDHHTLNDLHTIRHQYHRMVSTIREGQQQLTQHLRNVEGEYQMLQRREREEDSQCHELDVESSQLQRVSAVEVERQMELEELLKLLPSADADQESQNDKPTVNSTNNTFKSTSTTTANRLAPSTTSTSTIRPFVQSTKNRLAAAFSAMNNMNAKDFQNFSIRQMK